MHPQYECEIIARMRFLKLKMNLFRKIYSSTIYFIYSNLMANSLTGNDSVSSFETR